MHAERSAVLYGIGGGSKSAGEEEESEMEMVCRIRLVLALPEFFPGKGFLFPLYEVRLRSDMVFCLE